MTDIIRACCAAGMARAQAAGQPVPVFFDVAAGNAVGPVIRDVQPAPVSPEAAVHEAGHGVFGVLVGANVERLSIVGQPVALLRDGDLPAAFRVAINLAGVIGQAWGARHVHRRSDAEWADYIPNVRRQCNGLCDTCRAVTNAIIGTGWGDDGEVVNLLRRVEGIVVEAVRSPRIWQAINEIADRLREAGIVEGDEVIAIVAGHVGAVEIEGWKRRLSDGHR